MRENARALNARFTFTQFDYELLYHIALIEIIVFPSLHLNKNVCLMIRNDVFTGTVSASTILSTHIRFVFVTI